MASNLRRSKRTLGKRFSEIDSRVSDLEKRPGALRVGSYSIAENNLQDITITGSVLHIGEDGDIPEADPTSFHVDSDGNMWSGADRVSYATAPFRVSNSGGLDLSSTDGTKSISMSTNTDELNYASFEIAQFSVDEFDIESNARVTVFSDGIFVSVILDNPDDPDPDGEWYVDAVMAYGDIAVGTFGYVDSDAIFRQPLILREDGLHTYAGVETYSIFLAGTTGDGIGITLSEDDVFNYRSISLNVLNSSTRESVSTGWLTLYSDDGSTVTETNIGPDVVYSGGNIFTSTNYVSIPNWPTIVSPTVGLFSGTVFGVYFIGRSSSTREIKRNIVDIDGDTAMSTLSALQPRAFNYNYQDGVDEIGRRMSDEYVAYGFIAEEVAEVNRDFTAFGPPTEDWWETKDPETVTYEDFSTFKPVDWDQRAITALNVKATQELLRRVEALEARIENS